MLTIRLQRTGKKNQADFRIVLAEKEMPVKKKIVELLGSYNPRKKKFQVNSERVKYWLSTRVETSPTVHNLFVTHGILAGEKKVKAFNTPKKPVSQEAGAEKEVKPQAEQSSASAEASTVSEQPVA